MEYTYGNATVVLDFSTRSSWIRGAEGAHAKISHSEVDRCTSIFVEDFPIQKIGDVVYTPTSIVAKILGQNVRDTKCTHRLGKKKYTVVDDDLAMEMIEYTIGYGEKFGYSSKKSRARAEVIAAFVFAVVN